MSKDTSPSELEKQDSYALGELLMRIAEQAEGAKGYGVTPAFMAELDKALAQAYLDGQIAELSTFKANNFSEPGLDHQSYGWVVANIEDRLAELKSGLPL